MRTRGSRPLCFRSSSPGLLSQGRPLPGRGRTGNDRRRRGVTGGGPATAGEPLAESGPGCFHPDGPSQPLPRGERPVSRRPSSSSGRGRPAGGAVAGLRGEKPQTHRHVTFWAGTALRKRLRTSRVRLSATGAGGGGGSGEAPSTEPLSPQREAWPPDCSSRVLRSPSQMRARLMSGRASYVPCALDTAGVQDEHARSQSGPGPSQSDFLHGRICRRTANTARRPG